MPASHPQSTAVLALRYASDRIVALERECESYRATIASFDRRLAAIRTANRRLWFITWLLLLGGTLAILHGLT